MEPPLGQHFLIITIKVATCHMNISKLYLYIHAIPFLQELKEGCDTLELVSRN